MKLSKSQIQQLYSFTEKHYVEWYDLQTELVDHIAIGIENQIQENPILEFNQALKIEFKKFGVFGFMNVVEERQRSLSRKYIYIMIGYIKEWFGLPKIIISITMTYLIYALYNSNYGNYFYYFILLVVCLFGIVKAYKLKKEFNKKEKLTGKKWMFQEMIFKTSSANFLVLFLNMFNIYSFTETPAVWLLWLLAAFTTLLILVSFITLELIPSRAEKLLQDTYPEYKLV